MSMRFLVLLRVSGFLKFLKFQFQFEICQTSFLQTSFLCKFAHFHFSQHELHFCFHNRYNFSSRLTSAISLHAQVQFHAKYPLFDSQSDRGFTFSYAILSSIDKHVKDYLIYFLLGNILMTLIFNTIKLTGLADFGNRG